MTGPEDAAAPRSRLANDAGGYRGTGLTLRLRQEPTAPRRATSVPFTTVTTGHERTATDNTTAASTCALHQLPRERSWPIWLWEQEVAPGAIRSAVRPPCQADASGLAAEVRTS